MGNRIEITIALDEQDLEKLQQLAGGLPLAEYLTAAIHRLYTEQYIVGDNLTVERLINAVQAMIEEKEQSLGIIHVLREELKALQEQQHGSRGDTHQARTLIRQLRSAPKSHHLH